MPRTIGRWGRDIPIPKHEEPPAPEPVTAPEFAPNQFIYDWSEFGLASVAERRVLERIAEGVISSQLTEQVDGVMQQMAQSFADTFNGLTGMGANVIAQSGRRNGRQRELEPIQELVERERPDLRPFRGDRRPETPANIRSVRQARQQGWRPGRNR